MRLPQPPGSRARLGLGSVSSGVLPGFKFSGVPGVSCGLSISGVLRSHRAWLRLSCSRTRTAVGFPLAGEGGSAQRMGPLLTLQIGRLNPKRGPQHEQGQAEAQF